MDGIYYTIDSLAVCLFLFYYSVYTSATLYIIRKSYVHFM